MLKDGYYLSIYSSIDPGYFRMRYSERHDHNMTLWKKQGSDIVLVHHWEFERFTGIKHHNISFLNKDDLISYINQMLSYYSLSFTDIIAVFGTPGISNIENYYEIQGASDLSYHAVAHMFSSLIMDSTLFRNHTIISLAVDGGSDNGLDKDIQSKDMFLGAISRKGKIEYFPISSAALYWRIMRNIFKMEEGTLMALAYASQSVSYEAIPKSFLSKEKELYKSTDALKIYDLLVDVKNTIFSYTNEDRGIKFNYFDKRFTEEENKISMVMKIIQQISLDITDKIIDEIIRKYDINPEDSYIALSGGYALNCPTNTHIMNKYKFKDQLIIPSTNDGGQAIGMGLFFFYKYMGKFDFRFNDGFLGNSDENMKFLNKEENQIFIESIHAGMDCFVDDLILSPIVWFDGRSEIGPRALGHRSILADARNVESKTLLNQYKKRQWWRPVAPIILEEYIDDYFEDAFKSPYMLNNFKIKPGKKEVVPAILHLDDTCRIQSINKESNPRLYEAMKAFCHKTGVPVICNTSLNDQGEPIINTIGEAFNFALRKGIKIMYINGIRVTLKNHDKYDKKEPEKRCYAKYFEMDESDTKDFNPYQVTIPEYIYYRNDQRLADLKLINEKDVIKIKKMFNKVLALNPGFFTLDE